jgi:HK97 family phage prohead protease
MNLVSEFRSVDLVDAEVRKGREFRGYAAVFDSPWNDKLTSATGYIEKVARGIFRKVLTKGDDVPFLIAHDRNQLLGTTQSGNVRLREDGKGLLVESKLPDNYLGEYARSMIEAGDLKGMSYGYQLDPRRDTLLTRAGGVVTRTIAGLESLVDVSLTWEPAYTATTVELRSQDFVALPLQEILVGEGSQVQEAVTEKPSDEEAPDAAWWTEDSPADTAEGTDPVKGIAYYRDLYVQELGRELDGNATRRGSSA